MLAGTPFTYYVPHRAGSHGGRQGCLSRHCHETLTPIARTDHQSCKTCVVVPQSWIPHVHTHDKPHSTQHDMHANAFTTGIRKTKEASGKQTARQGNARRLIPRAHHTYGSNPSTPTWQRAKWATPLASAPREAKTICSYTEKRARTVTVEPNTPTVESMSPTGSV